jgi:fatty acid desaturase
MYSLFTTIKRLLTPEMKKLLCLLNIYFCNPFFYVIYNIREALNIRFQRKKKIPAGELLVFYAAFSLYIIIIFIIVVNIIIFK